MCTLNISVHKVCTFIQTVKHRSRFIWKNTTFPNSILVKTDVSIRAVGMLKAGLTQAQVAKDVGVNLGIQWKDGGRSGIPETRKGGERPSVRTAASKMLISKSVHKRGWSTRKLANKFSNRDHKFSKNTGFIRLNFGARLLKRQVVPKNQQKTGVMSSSTLQGEAELGIRRLE